MINRFRYTYNQYHIESPPLRTANSSQWGSEQGIVLKSKIGAAHVGFSWDGETCRILLRLENTPTQAHGLMQTMIRELL